MGSGVLFVIHKQTVQTLIVCHFLGHLIWVCTVCLAAFLWDIDKQYRPRSDAAECSVWSGSQLFAYGMIYQNSNKNEKYHPTTLKMEMDWSNWWEGEIPFKSNGLTIGYIVKIHLPYFQKRAESIKNEPIASFKCMWKQYCNNKLQLKEMFQLHETCAKLYWARSYKTFFMLNSTVHEISTSHKS